MYGFSRLITALLILVFATEGLSRLGHFGGAGHRRSMTSRSRHHRMMRSTAARRHTSMRMASRRRSSSLLAQKRARRRRLARTQSTTPTHASKPQVATKQRVRTREGAEQQRVKPAAERVKQVQEKLVHFQTIPTLRCAPGRGLAGRLGLDRLLNSDNLKLASHMRSSQCKFALEHTLGRYVCVPQAIGAEVKNIDTGAVYRQAGLRGLIRKKHCGDVLRKANQT